MLRNATTLLFFVGSALTWLGALRVYATLRFTAKRSQVIAFSTGGAAVCLIALAVREMSSASMQIGILHLLTAVNLGGAAVTYGLAAYKETGSQDRSHGA